MSRRPFSIREWLAGIAGDEDLPHTTLCPFAIGEGRHDVMVIWRDASLST